MTFKTILAGTALLATVAAGELVKGADWRFDPLVEVGAMSDSNLRLDEGGEKAKVAGAFANAQFGFVAETPVSEFRVAPRVEATWFPDEADSDEDYLNGGVVLSWLRRGRTANNQLRLDFDDSTSITGNRENVGDPDDGLGNPDDPGASGALDTRNRVRTLDVRDTLQLQFSQRNAMELSASYVDRKFDEQSISDDVSFVAWGATAGWRHQLRPTTSLAFRVRGLRYDPELIPLITENIGLEGEWRHRVTERFESYVRGGASRARYKGEDAAEGENAFVGGVGAIWRFRVSSVLLDATRSIDPNSSGYSVERNQLRLRLDRDFSERVRGSIAARYIDDNGPEGFNPRQYVVSSVAAEWRLTRVWSLSGRYDYSWQNYELTPGSAASNALRLSVVYQPRRAQRSSGSVLD